MNNHCRAASQKLNVFASSLWSESKQGEEKMFQGVVTYWLESMNGLAFRALITFILTYQ